MPFVNKDTYFQQDNLKIYMTTCNNNNLLNVLNDLLFVHDDISFVQNDMPFEDNEQTNKTIRQIRRSIDFCVNQMSSECKLSSYTCIYNNMPASFVVWSRSEESVLCKWTKTITDERNFTAVLFALSAKLY